MAQELTPSHPLVDLPRRADAEEVVYALKLRDISARIDRVFRSPIKPWFRVLVHEMDRQRCTEVLPLILDVMLPRRADDGAGNCHFCGYSLMGTSVYSATCPECGRDLTSVEARIAARDNTRLRERKDTSEG